MPHSQAIDVPHGDRSSQDKEDKTRCPERNHRQIVAVFIEISKFSSKPFSMAGDDDRKKRVKKASK
jgi:hypothetical protein